MKAVTLWQPWASLIALGVKTIETRSWCAPVALIGERIAIHAAKRHPDVDGFKGRRRLGDWWIDTRVDGFTMHRHQDFNDIPLPLGAVVATARLVDCVPMWAPNLVRSPGKGGLLVGTTTDPDRLLLWRRGSTEFATVTDQRPYGDFAPGRWAWMLADIEALAEPVPARGGQRVWNWESAGE